NYTITGSAGGIGGSGFLLKNGSGNVTIGANLTFSGATTINNGTVTLSGANTYAGGTLLTGGTLNVGSSSALGNGAVALAAGSPKTLDNTSGGAMLLTGVPSQAWS